MSMTDDLYHPGRGSLILQAVHIIKEQEEEEPEENELAKITFRQAEAETVDKVLQMIDCSAEKRILEGFNEFNFTVGVLNCILVAVVFAAYPQHFWLLYLIESLYLLPQTFLFNLRAKPLNQVLYFLDYCWVMNFLGVAILLSVSAINPLSLETRRQILMMAAGTSTGTLTGACLMLPFVAIVFHDLRTMTSVLIHLLPTCMSYTLVWNREKINQAWPTVFPYEFDSSEFTFFPGEDDKFRLFLPFTGLGTVAGNAIALYATWWILYVIWMTLLGGLNLPRKDRDKPPVYDTVFHATIRNGMGVVIGKVCWGRPVAVSERQQEMDHFEVRDFFVYMLFHAIAAYFGGTMLLANLSWHFRQAHISIIILLTVVSVYRGACRYTYYATEMYSRNIRKEFKDILPTEKEKKKEC